MANVVPYFPTGDFEIDFGVNNEINFTVLENRFGDGYTQRAADGLNSNRDTWSATWTNLKDSEAKLIFDFLRAREGYQPFYYQAPGDGVFKQWTARDIRRKPVDAGDVFYWTISATLKQEFGATIESKFVGMLVGVEGITGLGELIGNSPTVRLFGASASGLVGLMFPTNITIRGASAVGTAGRMFASGLGIKGVRGQAIAGTLSFLVAEKFVTLPGNVATAAAGLIRGLNTLTLIGQEATGRQGFINVPPQPPDAASVVSSVQVPARAGIISGGGGGTILGASGTSNPGLITTTSVPGDPFWPQTKLLLGFEGALDGKIITDESLGAHGTASVFGLARTVATQKKFGTTAVRFENDGDAVQFPDSPDWWFGAGAFTIEGFIFPEFVGLGNQFIACQWFSSGDISWVLANTDFKLRFNVSVTGLDTSNINVASSSTNLVANVWQHACIDFNGTKYRLYIDGVMVGFSTTPYTLFDSPNTLTLGTNAARNAFWYKGYIDEFRITKGAARYASDAGFTVPASAYPRS